MSKKISTEDCKRALIAAWPAEFGDQSGNWKRVSKSGKKGEPVVRLFYHRSLPLQATVVEHDGAIKETNIKGLGTWDLDQESEAYEEMAALVDSREGFDFISKHDLFKPCDFVFYVSPEQDTSMDDFPTWYVLTPVSYWKRERCAYDGELDHFIGRHLPEDGGEASEGTFCSELPPDAVRADLLQRGFIQDPAFDAFMSGAGTPSDGGDED